MQNEITEKEFMNRICNINNSGRFSGIFQQKSDYETTYKHYTAMNHNGTEYRCFYEFKSKEQPFVNAFSMITETGEEVRISKSDFLCTFYAVVQNWSYKYFETDWNRQ